MTVLLLIVGVLGIVTLVVTREIARESYQGEPQKPPQQDNGPEAKARHDEALRNMRDFLQRKLMHESRR
jgi:hypothetical protein